MDLYRFLLLITTLSMLAGDKPQYQRLQSIERKYGIEGELEIWYHRKVKVIVICCKGNCGYWMNNTTASVVCQLTYFKTPKEWGTIMHIKDGATGALDPSFRLMAEKSGRKEFIAEKPLE